MTERSSDIRAAVDIGGTFTDLVAVDEQSGEVYVGKSPSSGADPVAAVRAVMAEVGLPHERITTFVHGTTVATNALIEREGSRVAFITNEGFRDVLFIQDGTRRDLYSLEWEKPRPLVSRYDCLELSCRVDSEGNEIAAIDDEQVDALISHLREEGIRSVAIGFLFAYLNPVHELELERRLADELDDLKVSTSHQVYPRWRENDRWQTVVADAFLKSMFSDYVRNMEDGLRASGVDAPLVLMKSNGGVVDAAAAAARPVNYLLSGPVGGVMGGVHLAGLAGFDRVMTIDIGGTSSDISLVAADDIPMAASFELGHGLPIKAPQVAVNTIGAGGGSVGWIDSGGLLRVGPQSAGSLPGPACYRRGGTRPTITDASLALGRLNPDSFCGGQIKLDERLAVEALEGLTEPGRSVQDVAQAMIDLATNDMADALRLISVRRGIDPRDFVLVAFGGAGGLHAAEVARALEVDTVLIPMHPGNTSAYGQLSAGMRTDLVTTLVTRSDDPDAVATINSRLVPVRVRCLEGLRAEGDADASNVEVRLEMRYYGQNYHREIVVAPELPLSDDDLRRAVLDFHADYERYYGYQQPTEPVEVVGASVRAWTPRSPAELRPPEPTEGTTQSTRPVWFGPRGLVDTPILERASLAGGFTETGPLIVEEALSTTVVPPDAQSARPRDRQLAGGPVREDPIATSPTAFDTTTLTVTANYLANLTREMGEALQQAAYSTVFNEARDFSCTVFDDTGEIIGQGEFCPSQLAATSFAIENIIDRFPVETMRADEVYLSNDPFSGMNHLPEHMVVRPVFEDSEHIGFVVCIGHLSEVGGLAPGGFPGDAREVFHEGLRIPPVRIVKEGREDEELLRVILANGRTPRVTAGDLRAMIGCLAIGERRLRALTRKHGIAGYRHLTRQIKDHSERRMRAALAEIPDGTYEASELLIDNDGVDDEPARVRVSVTIEGDRVVADFTGSDPQRSGPVNSTAVATICAVYNAVLHLTDPTIPVNAGRYRPIEVVLPEASVVNAAYPAATVGGNTEVHPHIVTLIWKAIAPAVPERVAAAASETWMLVTFGGSDPKTGEPFATLMLEAQGWGGRLGADGWDAVGMVNGNCPITPIEVLETRYPLRHRAYGLNPGSGGAGAVSRRARHRAARRAAVRDDLLLLPLEREARTVGPVRRPAGNAVLLSRQVPGGRELPDVQGALRSPLREQVHEHHPSAGDAA